MTDIPKIEIPALRADDTTQRSVMPVGERASVLIVDDTPAKLTSLVAIVSGMALEIVTANSGEQALRQLLKRDFALILLDVNMPTMDGFETATLIRSRPRSAHTPIVFVTAEANLEAERFRGYIHGAVDFIYSPIVPEILRAKVRVFVDLFCLQRQLMLQHEHLESLVAQRTTALTEEIAEHKRARDALTERELRYRKLTEASFDGIAITVEGVITEANPGVAEIFGYPLDEVISRPILDFVADESREAVLQRFSKGEEGRFELTGKHKDGRKIQLETTTRQHNVSGRSGRILAIRDVTEKRVLEAQLRQTQKMDAIGQLAGGVAHDFNNLLTAILGYSNFVIDTFEPQDRRRADMEEVIKAGQQAAALTRQLLAFSRKQILQPTAVDLNAVVTGIHQMLSRLIGEHVDLVPILAPDLGAVRADSGQLEQVLMNLVLNARDAMPSGGRVVIETSNIELDETSVRQHVAVRPGSYVMLGVSDTGHGMDEQTQSRLFEPFFTTKEPGKGTGLGLSTVYGIVKQSGGNIRVDSKPGHGTTFTIYLPRVAEIAEPLAMASPPVGPPTGTETILVVEDTGGLRALARKILERYGYTVIDAPNGEEALRICERHEGTIHLLLTDVVMPGMSGRVLADLLAQLRSETKVLFTSGYTDDAIVHHGILRTGSAFLQKPYVLDSLARKVREVLDAST